MIVGNLTHTGATVASKVTGSSIRLVVSTASNLSTFPIYFGPVSGASGYVKIDATGLQNKTQYYYALEVDGVLQSGNIGSFQTPGRPGTQYSFKFWAASCAGNSISSGYSSNGISNHPVFTDVRNQEPLFGIHMGDFFYKDIGVNSQPAFDSAWDANLAQSHQANLYKNVPLNYFWDDHDFGPNDSDRNSPSKPAAQAVYRKRAPHYELPSATGLIYQTFVIGRVRFIGLDGRSERSTIGSTDNSSKSMIGTEQKAWLKSTLLAATEPIIFISVSVPWISPVDVTSDDWGGYSTERAELAAFIKSNNLEKRIIFLAGDAHMLALDSGVNNNYSNIGCPVFQLASLDANGSDKGGPYSTVTYPGGGQFGLIYVDDYGSRIKVRVEAKRGTENMLTHEVTVEAPPPLAPDLLAYNSGFKEARAGVVAGGAYADDRTVSVYIDGGWEQVNDK